MIALCRAGGADLVVVETPGIGQGDAAIVTHADVSLYVMTPEFGAATQLEKIDMLELADVVAINKFERAGADDAFRDVRRQMARIRGVPTSALDDLPVYGTMAARFHDDGVTALAQELLGRLREEGLPVDDGALATVPSKTSSRTTDLVPRARVPYLAEVSETVRGTTRRPPPTPRPPAARRSSSTSRACSPSGATRSRRSSACARSPRPSSPPDSVELLRAWPAVRDTLAGPDATRTTLSGTVVPRVALPRVRRARRAAALASLRAPARSLPVHRRRVPVQAP